MYQYACGNIHLKNKISISGWAGKSPGRERSGGEKPRWENSGGKKSGGEKS